MYSPPNPPVTLIAGAYCPACGEPTLGVRTSKVVCLGSGCQRPTAAHDTLSIDRWQHAHLLTFTADGVEMRHPLLERLVDTMPCAFTQVVARLRQPLGIGSFYVLDGDLHDIKPCTLDDMLDPDYVGAIDRALALHPLDDFVVGSVVRRADYVAPGEPLREGWLDCDGTHELDPADYPEFATVHVEKGGTLDQPIRLPDLTRLGPHILRVR